MRVEITCDNRVGILQEIMGIFGEYKINVTSGELGGDSGDKVFLSAPSMLAAQYQTIEKSLLRVPGVRKVRRIALIPSERRHFELDTLLRHVADPVLSVDREGRIVAANLAAARAFGVSLDRVPGLQLQRFLPRLQLAHLLRDFTVPRYGVPVTVRGRDYRMEWSPIALPESGGAVESLAGAVVTLQRQDATAAAESIAEPHALWDYDARRNSCLQLQELAALHAPLLIVGERGSGKSTFAVALHYLSPRGAGGNCYRLPAESELRLPASLQPADTLILEDLHRWPLELQQQLVHELRALPVDLRLVATSSDEGKIYPALAQRFSSLALRLPPLRAMRPALPRFAAAVIGEQLKEGEKITCSEPVLELLRGHDWPNNFSDLKDYLLAALTRCRARKAQVTDVEDLPDLAVSARLPWHDWARGLDYRQMMELIERALLGELVEENPSTRELAKRLGISHTAVANKLRKYGLNKPRP